MTTSKVFLRSSDDMPVRQAVSEVMEACNWRELVPPGGSVVLKPNLCTDEAEKAPSANTDPRVVEAVVEVLQERTRDIVIGESDGPRHKTEAAFAASGLPELAERLGVRLVDFSRAPTRPVDHPLLAGFELPAAMLDADLVVTLPVIKTHALTAFTGAIKNQWGCVPRYDRILLHKHLDTLLADLVGLLRPRLAIMDGILCVEGRGPANGKPRRLGVVMGATDMVAMDATAMRLIGLDPRACGHLQLAHARGHGRIAPQDIEVDGPFDRYRCDFEPGRLDWALRAMNYMTRYRFFTYKVLFNDAIFRPTRELVQWLRAVGVV